MSNATTHIEIEKQLAPALRFKEFEGEWENNRLHDLTNLITKGTTPKTFTSSGVNYVKIEGLVGVNINKDKCVHIDEEVHLKELKRSILQENDLLFAIAGATVGKVGIVTSDILPANTNQALAIIRLKNKEYLNYILQILQSRVMKKYIYQSVSVGAQPNLNLEQIGDFRFNLPSLPEQQKIASFLFAVDEKIQQLTKKKELLEDYKKGGLQHLFSGQLRFKDKNGNPYPDWEEKRLKDVLYEHKTKNKDGSVTEVFSVAKQKGVINQIEHLGRSFAASTTLHYKVAFPGDLIYTKSPTKDFPFGIIKQNLTGRKGLVSPLYVVTKPQTNSLGFMFHCYFLSWVNVFNYLVPLVQKGAKNTMNINNDEFLNGAKFTLPVSEKEQQKIARYLSSIDTKIEAVNNQITQTQTFKKGILQQMFI